MDDDALLGVVYRGRPQTLAELVALAHESEADVSAAIERIQRRGLINRHGERLVYPHPADWATQAVTAEFARMRQDAGAALARVERTIADLPGMLRRWSVGDGGSDAVPMLTRHGPQAAEDLWIDTADTGSGTALAVFPDVDRFLATTPERAARFAQAFAAKDAVRGIVPSSVSANPALLAIAEHYALAGVQLRTLDAPPSWFWVDGDLLALPHEWGEAWPTSVLGVQSASLAALARTFFEELWRRAEPIATRAPAWTPLLRLMRRGMTLDAASRTLGVNPRTGRRRIAAAMDHYGVSTLFALGVAWAADGARPEA